MGSEGILDFLNFTTEDPHSLLYNVSTEDDPASTTLSPYLRDQRELREVFSNTEAIFLTVLLTIFSVFGIVANIGTFVVILTTPKLSSSVFNIFLMSLCVSDFLSAADSPLVLYRGTWGFYEWKLPHILCKIAISVDFWTSCVTIQHILIFAILRFISIKFPHRFGRVRPIHAKVIIVFVWIETFLASWVVYFLWPGVFPPGGRTPDGKLSKACTAQGQWVPMLLKYVQIGFPTILYAPMVAVIAVTIALLALIIKRQKDKNKVGSVTRKKVKKKENFALVQLSLIIASFMLGYLPDVGYRMTAVIVRSQNRSLPARVEWQFTITAHCLLRLSECLNPVFYNLGSSKMRKATYNFLARFLPLGEENSLQSSNFATSRQSGAPASTQTVKET